MLAGNRDLAATRERLQGWLAGRMPKATTSSLRPKKPSACSRTRRCLRGRAGGTRRSALLRSSSPAASDRFQLPGTTWVPVPHSRSSRAPTVVLGPPSVRCTSATVPRGFEFYVLARLAAIPSGCPPITLRHRLCFARRSERRAAMWWAASMRWLASRPLGAPPGLVPPRALRRRDPLDRIILYLERPGLARSPARPASAL